MTRGMEITSEEYDGVLKINLSGRLDMGGARVLDDLLAQLGLRKNLLLIINLEGVDFIASIGIRSFMMAAKTIKGRKGACVLMSPQPMVAEVLARTSVETLIPVCPTFEAAWNTVWQQVLAPA